ncbi:SDR family NAD(P)-dependent oxidoreductase [Chondromyces apiculatus]|uniref:Short-chain dehydrogenase/reductase SDR n=1 Tax=Chondromyces apiculatus DSM 436 TaxID=1192034 RepID=A0A017TAD6_9BACT|nr:SDR family oxidoreductase [Chondromyces apiculatus]EYF06194.1 Short-chain dehydrogenase/reductase SDR [Chondromyces apiculatus DSM 436]
MSVTLAGKTALVTGASAGIGREIAKVLAREVGALILVARRRERLDELAAELTAARPGLRVVVRSVDLLDREVTGAFLDDLESEGERIDVFVNNAGFGDYAFFAESAWPKVEQMLELNVVSATYLLHRIVPTMVARGAGAILNVGSCAGIAASPQMVAYSATKAFVNLLSDGLRAELAGTGVSVTNLSPGPVPTEFQEVAGSTRRETVPEALHVSVDLCAEEAVTALKAGRARVIPGLPMRAAMLSLESVPKVLVRPVIARMAKKSKGRS